MRLGSLSCSVGVQSSESKLRPRQQWARHEDDIHDVQQRTAAIKWVAGSRATLTAGRAASRKLCTVPRTTDAACPLDKKSEH
jgi:hypothetical protein